MSQDENINSWGKGAEISQKVTQTEMKTKEENMRKLECPTFNSLIRVLESINNKKNKDKKSREYKKVSQK